MTTLSTGNLQARGWKVCPVHGDWLGPFVACRHCGWTNVPVGTAVTRHGKGVVPEAMEPKARKAPNNTEARYWQDRLASGPPAAYEAVTLLLPGGHRYTPDWVVRLADGRLECHEVKGSYHHASRGRSRLAFDLAAVTYPRWVWVWAEWDGREWKTEVRGEGKAGGMATQQESQ